MESWHWAVGLRPLFTAALLVITGALIVYPLKRFLPEGKLKRALLWRTTRARGFLQNLFVWLIILSPFVFIGWLASKQYPY